MAGRCDRVCVGELRQSSGGNIYKLVRIDGKYRFVQRISNGGAGDLWDAGIIYRWLYFQWEQQLPLVGGDTSHYPHFGIFVP